MCEIFQFVTQRYCRPSVYWLIGGLLALLLQVSTEAHAARLALVIGNAAYQQSPLKNPVNDARAMDTKLRSLGFAVTKVENLKRDQIGRMLSGFVSRIQPGDEVVVFYAGHGLQVKGENYLPAVDAQISTEDDVPLNSLNLRSVLERLDEAKAGVKLLLLDACRNNPYARSFRSASRGMARMQDAPSGTLMHFATRPGSVANDGDGVNGLYTAELLKLIDQPGVPVEQLFKRVTAAVERASGGQQEPWVEGSLKGEFYFRADTTQQQVFASVGQSASPTARPTTSSLDLGDLRRQAVAETSQERSELSVLQRMQADYNAVESLAGSARIKAQGWDKFLIAWPLSKAPGDAGMQLRQKAELQQAAVRADSERAVVAAADRARPIGQVFRDCAGCPEMVMVPSGEHLMGTPSGANPGLDEQPLHSVRIQRFALGKFEVTQAEWMAVMGRNPSVFNDCGDECPVETVSWDDVQEFLKRLNQKTGRQYRLPTEAEWEYAARAGKRTTYWWGDEVSREYANYGHDECCGGNAQGLDRWESTAPKGQFRSNPFGLHDMHGNVWEWVQDCYLPDYNGAPEDGSAVEVANCSRRVLRGGSWFSYARELRTTYRFGSPPDYRGVDMGFRLARPAL